MLEIMDAVGEIHAVGDALVDGDAQVDGLAQLLRAVFKQEALFVFLADDDEDGVRAPVRQVMILRAHADAAEVGDENRAAVRVFALHGGGHPPALFQKIQRSHNQVGDDARHAHDHVHYVRRTVALLLFAHVVDEGAHLLIHLLDHRALVVEVDAQDGNRLGGMIFELLFDDEGIGNFLAVEVSVARDEPVEQRALIDGFRQRGEDRVKHRVFEFNAFDVFLLQPGVERGQIDGFGHDGFVVGAVGHDVGHDLMHAVQPAHEPCVRPVAAAMGALFDCHEGHPPLERYKSDKFCRAKRGLVTSQCANKHLSIRRQDRKFLQTMLRLILPSRPTRTDRGKAFLQLFPTSGRRAAVRNLR